MVWSGTPFPFIDSLMKDNIVLQITKLPTLMVDSGFPWENLVGSFIAGSIPAFIAWKTIKYNNELIKRQITVAAQQKKCDELRELFSRFLSLYESTINYVDLLLSQYLEEDEELPFEKYADIKDDLTKLAHCTNLIYLMIGTNNEYYERLTNTVNKFEEKVSSYFDDYKKNSSHMVFSIRNDVKEFLELFNEILEAEQSKI
ncbi:TPA: hypothetical protein MBD98_001251 [Klebsiella aerogenes]|uniref:hypothetical protein n=1 Tax=Klebsiella aerogenes TaxID=548 RepID=UPI001C230C32|nr:hypothetical protein [Klebsiella aerogenes]QXA74160.1 hypothetical protein I6L71_24670 [Klebsiella aerogenes]HBT2486642.1 hypothetical protein [Klebsiella aerogenes]HBT2497497.1 hypothetical protein [Klebsiella aerogenes]HBW3047689.1 hypothetical protein [Klebsiella aerogenes]